MLFFFQFEPWELEPETPIQIER